MKQYIGKQCKIFVRIEGRRLFYSGEITEVSEGHVSFIDKFGELYTYNKQCIEEIRLR